MNGYTWALTFLAVGLAAGLVLCELSHSVSTPHGVTFEHTPPSKIAP